MKENSTPPSANPVTISTLTKEQVLASLTATYAEAKPVQDKMVDLSLITQALTAEIYRRSIIKQLPGIPIRRVRTVMRAAVSIHPNHGLPQIAQRLAGLIKEGIEIIEVRYDENTGEFSFYAAPEFQITGETL